MVSRLSVNKMTSRAERALLSSLPHIERSADLAPREKAALLFAAWSADALHASPSLALRFALAATLRRLSRSLETDLRVATAEAFASCGGIALGVAMISSTKWRVVRDGAAILANIASYSGESKLMILKSTQCVREAPTILRAALRSSTTACDNGESARAAAQLCRFMGNLTYGWGDAVVAAKAAMAAAGAHEVVAEALRHYTADDDRAIHHRHERGDEQALDPDAGPGAAPGSELLLAVDTASAGGAVARWAAHATRNFCAQKGDIVPRELFGSHGSGEALVAHLRDALVTLAPSGTAQLQSTSCASSIASSAGTRASVCTAALAMLARDSPKNCARIAAAGGVACATTSIRYAVRTLRDFKKEKREKGDNSDDLGCGSCGELLQLGTLLLAYGVAAAEEDAALRTSALLSCTEAMGVVPSASGVQRNCALAIATIASDVPNLRAQRALFGLLCTAEGAFPRQRRLLTATQACREALEASECFG